MNALPRAGGDSKRKLAERVARHIEQGILRDGPPVGSVYGSETELIERYGVSRAVFREAVRLLESRLVARMRRGRGGGLIVTEPAAEAVSDVMSVYLQYRGVGAKDLREARVAIEIQCIEMAVARLDDSGREQLSAYLAREASSVLNADGPVFESAHGFHSLVASLSGNAALDLFVRCLIDLTEHQPQGTQDLEARAETHRAHVAIAEAMVRGDTDKARRRMERHLLALESWWRDREER